MVTDDEDRIASILAGAPALSRLALGASSPKLVERAARKIAIIIVARMNDPASTSDDNRQLVLPISIG